MKYIIGVDAGGTKTIAVAYNLEGFRLDAFSTGPGNGLAAGDDAVENICGAVRSCIEAVGGTCLFVGVGMAGIDPNVLSATIRQRLRDQFAVDSQVVDDGTLALCAAHGGGDGLLVIAGTGSIAYGKRGDRTLRRGGWGHILGDRGSGYSIATDAIRLALQDQDDGLPIAPLTGALLRRIDQDGVRSLVEHVYRRPKADTAALCSVVSDQAEQADARAAGLLRAAGEELADLASALAGRLGLDAPAVALSGGVLTGIPAVRLSFAERLQMALPKARISTDTVDPPKGALCLYHKRMGAMDR